MDVVKEETKELERKKKSFTLLFHVWWCLIEMK